MIDSDIKRALRHVAGVEIYRRGEAYYHGGHVTERHIANDIKETAVFVTGEVSGNDDYEAGFLYDFAGGMIGEHDCTCPYDDFCKHLVALGLEFAEVVQNFSLTLASRTENPADFCPRLLDYTEHGESLAPILSESTAPELVRLRESLKQLGLSADMIPEEFLGKLLHYRAPAVSSRNVHALAPPTPKHRPAPKPKKFDLKKYFVVLEEYQGFMPTLRHLNNPYQYASITNVLGHRTDLTAEECAVLEYIRDHGGQHSHALPLDFSMLFRLLKESGIPVYPNSHSLSSGPLDLVLLPPKIAATLAYVPLRHHTNERIRHEFTFTLRSDPAHSKIISGKEMVVHNGKKLELHTLTEELGRIVRRAAAFVQYDYRTMTYERNKTALVGKELERVNEIIADASRLFDLTAENLAPPYAITRYSEATPCIAVNYNASSSELKVTPAIDYGFFRHDVSESVYVSRRKGRESLSWRGTWEHPGEHIVVVDNERLSIAHMDKKKEIVLHKTLRGTDVGFSKTLKCNKSGAKQVAKFLEQDWPKLEAFARKKNYPIVMVGDTLVPPKAAFRADFAADLDAASDLLHFDVDCYMGEEQVTLVTLREYLKSGEAFLRRADGTLLAIENREDLERFVRMLESFRAREEGGFEGKLHTAAELQYVMTSSKHYNAARTASFAQFTKALERGKPVKKAKIPARLNRILRDYQKDGINWMYFLRSYRFAGILADDMGLGKTLQTLALLSLERVQGKPSLVVCPKTLLYNWKREAAQFTPEMRVAVVDGTPSEREKTIVEATQYDLIITSYSAIKKDAELYEREGIRFNYCVLDEAQFIKNHATKNAQIVKKIPSDYRLALTGTPLENSVSEIWSVFDFLMPGFLGTYESFNKHFHKPIMDAGDRNALLQLRRKISCFMLRRTKGEVLGELPPKIEQESRCHLDPAQNILYQEILTKVRRDIFSTVEQQGFSKSQIHILAGLTKLRQVCNHPALLLKPKDHRMYESAKLAMCMELVEEVVSGKRKVLIFSQFTQMLDIVAKELDDRSIVHCYLSGKTKDRQKVVDEFNTDPSVSAFLISLKAGGTGLNLTSADTVIIFDPWWNPSVENQAIDRAHRIGQRQSVNVYRLITEGTIEEKIQELQKKKKNLFDALIDESADLFKKLTWDDVKALFQ